MNQDLRVFGLPMAYQVISIPATLPPRLASWNWLATAPYGLGTNWNVAIRDGDSSLPERFLIGNQLVLISHHTSTTYGPNLAAAFAAINQKMLYLSTNNNLGTNYHYQLTPFSLTNWPTVH